MFHTLKSHKAVRIVGGSAVLGSAAALLFLGAPADAAVLIRLGRGI